MLLGCGVCSLGVGYALGLGYALWVCGMLLGSGVCSLGVGYALCEDPSSDKSILTAGRFIENTGLSV